MNAFEDTVHSATRSLVEFVVKFFKRLEKQTGALFVVNVTLLALLFKFLAVIPTYLLFETIGANDLFNQTLDLQTPDPTVLSFLLVVLFAPAIETVAGQWIPIMVLSQFTKNKASIIFISAAIFGLFHLPAVAFIPSAFMIGILLSWTFMVKGGYGSKLSETGTRGADYKSAFLYTFAVHALHNLISFGLVLL